MLDDFHLSSGQNVQENIEQSLMCIYYSYFDVISDGNQTGLLRNRNQYHHVQQFDRKITPDKAIKHLVAQSVIAFTVSCHLSTNTETVGSLLAAEWSRGNWSVQ